MSSTNTFDRLQSLALLVTDSFGTDASQNFDESLHSAKDTVEQVVSTQKIVADKESTTLSVISAGFNYGDFAEVIFGQKIFLPKSFSKRGLYVLCLNIDHSSFYAWHFDFFPASTAQQTNLSFIQLIEKIPANIYFTIVVKDDIFKHLNISTKHFLAQVVGSKSIYNLRFRDSWAIVIHKPTISTYKVMAESHNQTGIAQIKLEIYPPTKSI